MNKQIRTLLVILVVPLLQACTTPQEILYDNRIPINDRNEKYQEALAARQASRRDDVATDMVRSTTALCAGDARYGYASGMLNSRGVPKNTCFVPSRIECETLGLKYRFSPVQWRVGERQGTVTTNENGDFFVPVDKSELDQAITLQVGEVRVASVAGPNLELKVSEKMCRGK